MNPLDQQYLEEFLLAATFRDAKTMPQNPHSYTLRKTWADDDAFCMCATLIREFGYREKFGRTWYKMYAFGEYKYWSMGSPILWGDRITYWGNTSLINRKLIGIDPADKSLFY